MKNIELKPAVLRGACGGRGGDAAGGAAGDGSGGDEVNEHCGEKG